MFVAIILITVRFAVNVIYVLSYCCTLVVILSTMVILIIIVIIIVMFVIADDVDVFSIVLVVRCIVYYVYDCI